MYFVFYFLYYLNYSIVFHFEIKYIILFSKYLGSWNKIVFCISYCKIVFLHNSALQKQLSIMFDYRKNSLLPTPYMYIMKPHLDAFLDYEYVEPHLNCLLSCLFSVVLLSIAYYFPCITVAWVRFFLKRNV